MSKKGVVTLEGHCIHFPDFEPDTVRCSVCIHGVPEAKEPKPDDWFIAPTSGSVVDPGDVLLEGLLAGVVCPTCLTDRTGLGCSCSRGQIGQRDLDASFDFLEAATEASDMPVKIAAGFATSVVKRVVRRMDLTPDEADEIRSDARARFSVEPKWFAPRVNEPTHLPV